MPNKITPEQKSAMADFERCFHSNKRVPVTKQAMSSLVNSAYKNPKSLPATVAAAKGEMSRRTGKTITELDAIYAAQQQD
jgi:hypothetical protein